MFTHYEIRSPERVRFDSVEVALKAAKDYSNRICDWVEVYGITSEGRAILVSTTLAFGE